jgi:pimeloyl-ACP methyl ester carboxylesterase
MAVEPRRLTTPSGVVEHVDDGTGPPVLFVHGSPGGCDQGALMGGFLRDAGFRVVALSRPGYLGTPLTDDVASPTAQAALAGGLLDALGIDRVRVVCWSGGGPASYTLAGTEPGRVEALVAIAAVSHDYTFGHPHEEAMLTGRFGGWLTRELVRHAPHSVVQSLVGEEGDLTHAEAKALAEQIWADPVKRDFALRLMETVSGARRDGLHNDERQFPAIGDLPLAAVEAPTLLLHATTDADVPFEHSEHAVTRLPHAELVRIAGGTHVSVWTDPDADALQSRIVDFLGS